MIRAVVDTNVYVSALVFGGVPALALQLAELGAFQLVASREYARNSLLLSWYVSYESPACPDASK